MPNGLDAGGRAALLTGVSITALFGGYAAAQMTGNPIAGVAIGGLMLVATTSLHKALRVATDEGNETLRGVIIGALGFIGLASAPLTIAEFTNTPTYQAAARENIAINARDTANYATEIKKLSAKASYLADRQADIADLARREFDTGVLSETGGGDGPVYRALQRLADELASVVSEMRGLVATGNGELANAQSTLSMMRAMIADARQDLSDPEDMARFERSSNSINESVQRLIEASNLPSLEDADRSLAEIGTLTVATADAVVAKKQNSAFRGLGETVSGLRSALRDVSTQLRIALPSEPTAFVIPNAYIRVVKYAGEIAPWLAGALGLELAILLLAVAVHGRRLRAPSNLRAI